MRRISHISVIAILFLLLTASPARPAGYEVDALNNYGAGKSYTKATIDAALAAIGTTSKATLLLRPGQWEISTNADWSAYTNVTFKPVPGAVMRHGSYSINIPNPEAGFYQWLSGTGEVKFSGSVPKVPIQWFGAVGNGFTSDSAAIQAALNSVSKLVWQRAAGSTEFTQHDGVVYVPRGTYAIGSKVIIPAGVLLEGESINTVRFRSTVTDGSDVFDASVGLHGRTSFKNFTIWGNGGANTGAGINLNGAYFKSYIEKVSIGNCADGLIVTNGWTLVLRDSQIARNTRGVTWVDATNAIIENNRFDNNVVYNIMITTAHGTTIAGNAIQKSNADGMILKDATGCLLSGNFFEDNCLKTASGSYDLQLLPNGRSASRNVSLISNMFITNKTIRKRDSAIYSEATYPTFLGNYFSPNYKSTNTSYGECYQIELVTSDIKATAVIIGGNGTNDSNHMINRSGWAGQFYNLSDSNYMRFEGNLIISNGSDGGGLILSHTKKTKTLSGFSTLFDFDIPSGARLKAVTFRVDKAITSRNGATNWGAALTGGSTKRITAGNAFTKNTKVNMIIGDEITANTTNMSITPNVGTFSGGQITAVAYYESMADLSDAP